MSDQSLKERLRSAALGADRAGLAAIAGVISSRVLAWSLPTPPADQLLIVPQDLRTADPSFWREIQHGQFGLAGSLAFLHKRTPFDIEPPTPAWERELHGFGWLRNLSAVEEEGARKAARRLTVMWVDRFGNSAGVASEPAVAARRLISWLSHAALLLDGADARTYETVTASLGRQLAQLSSSWREALDGYPRLLCLIALTLADLSIAGRERHLKEMEATLSAELDRQILPDGGHVSRNPSVLVELMLDLLPLSQCFVARDRSHPTQLLEAIARIWPMLRFLRLGDGMLARFNGTSVPFAAGLGTVFAYDDGWSDAITEAPASGYVRMQHGASILIADVAGPPALALAGEAQAGCLSFELSSGSQLLLVNGGMPGPAGPDWEPAARATANHNTLCLGEQSSSMLAAHRRLEAITGSAPIRHPDTVEWTLNEVDEGMLLQASHDGYHRRFGLIHTRRLFLSADGRRLEGSDRLEGLRQVVRLRTDLPFAIHFHLYPDVTCWLSDEPSTVGIRMADGEFWRFTAEGAAVSIEDSAYFANSTGPRRALQIVLRAATFGESEVNWVIERAIEEKQE